MNLTDDLCKITVAPSVAQPWETQTAYITGEITVIAQEGDFMVLKYDSYYSGTGHRRTYVPVTYKLVEVTRKEKSSIKKINYSNNSEYSVPAEDFWYEEVASCAPGKDWRQQSEMMVESMEKMAHDRATPYPEHVWPQQETP